MASTEYVTLTVDIAGETEKAFNVCVVDDLGREQHHWIPKSCIEQPEDYAVDDEQMDMNVAKWLLDERGIDY